MRDVGQWIGWISVSLAVGVIGYGAEVLAVADATVATTRDDMSESASITEHPKAPLEDDSGNYVTLDLGNRQYAFYEHLKPGSIRVKAGDHGRRGELLGLLGYTGESTGPHLHFHLSDANATLDAEGLPYAFQPFQAAWHLPLDRGSWPRQAVVADRGRH